MKKIPKKSKKITGNFIDPTDDAQQFVVDSQGRYGITDDENDTVSTGRLHKNASKSDVVAGMSDATYKGVREAGADPGETEKASKRKREEKVRYDEEKEIRDDDQKLFGEATPPDVEGNQSISGSLPSPDSDDDVLENAHDVGIATDADEEHPKELDIASDIDKAEKAHRQR